MSLCVLSCCYERPELANILRESCERFKLPLRFCKAKSIGDVWNGDMISAKIAGPLEIFPRLLKEGFTHILWADGFDSIVRASEVIIWQSYTECGAPPMLFSAEKNCFPDKSLLPRYPVPKSGSEYRFLNAGGWMGQIEFMQGLFEYAVLQPGSDDQDVWSRIFVNERRGLGLDTDCLVFQTMWGTRDEDVRSVPDGGACVVHYNAGYWRDPEASKRIVNCWESVKKVRY